MSPPMVLWGLASAQFWMCCNLFYGICCAWLLLQCTMLLCVWIRLLWAKSYKYFKSHDKFLKLPGCYCPWPSYSFSKPLPWKLPSLETIRVLWLWQKPLERMQASCRLFTTHCCWDGLHLQSYLCGVSCVSVGKISAPCVWAAPLKSLKGDISTCTDLQRGSNWTEKMICQWQRKLFHLWRLSLECSAMADSRFKQALRILD